MNNSEVSEEKRILWDTTAPKVILTDQLKRDGLTKLHFAAYAVGHFCNDLCASCWFTYLLYYVKAVVKLPDYISGFVMLSGQIADGITTPIVGFFSDKTNTRIGKRTPWYIFGTIFVIPTYLGIFIYPDFPMYSVTVAWYVILPALFNIGIFIF